VTGNTGTDTPKYGYMHSASFRLALSLSITLGFVVLEAFAGWHANSLALLSDAGHNLTDVLALGLVWFALRLSLRPADTRRTFGYHRAGILAASINAVTLVVIAIFIFYEAYQRFVNPPQVQSTILILVGALAVVVNLVTALLIRRSGKDDLNIRSAFIHLMGDVFSTIGATIAGVIILFTGWNWLDPLVSVLIGGLILWAAWGVLRDATDILLESAPRDVDLDALVADMLQVEGVQEVHDLHVWSINQSMRTLSTHVVIEDMPVSAGVQVQTVLNRILAERYDIQHATLQLEHVCCQPGKSTCYLVAGSVSD
jgi:cobalt-zinc-cadmium efflux system protein